MEAQAVESAADDMPMLDGSLDNKADASVIVQEEAADNEHGITPTLPANEKPHAVIGSGTAPGPVPPGNTDTEATAAPGQPARLATRPASRPVASGSATASGGSAAASGGTRRVVADVEEELSRLREFIEGLGGTLGEGWRIETKIRSGGSSAGQVDIYFHDAAGKRYRSKQEVARAVGAALPAPPRGSGSASRASRAGAAAAAQERAAKLRDKLVGRGGGEILPLALGDSLTLVLLGEPDARPGFCNSTQIFPVGLRTVWTDPVAGQLVSQIIDSGSGTPSFKISIKPPGAGSELYLLQGPDPDAAWSKLVEEQTKALIALRPPPKPKAIKQPKPSAPAAGIMSTPTVMAAAEGSVTEGTTDTPHNVTTEAAPPCSVADATREAAASPLPPTPPPAAPAPAAQVAARPPVQLNVRQQALARFPPLLHVWGLERFGLADVRVLQLLEGLPAVAERCEAYEFIDQRGSTWEIEAAAFGKVAERYATEKTRALKKWEAEQKRAYAGAAPKRKSGAGPTAGCLTSGGAATSNGAPSTAATAPAAKNLAPKKQSGGAEPAELAEGCSSDNEGRDDSKVDGSAAKASSGGTTRTAGKGSRSVESQVRGVLDRIIKKLEVRETRAQGRHNPAQALTVKKAGPGATAPRKRKKVALEDKPLVVAPAAPRPEPTPLLPLAGAAAVPVALALRPAEDGGRLLQVWDFFTRFRGALKLEAAPTVGDLVAMCSAPAAGGLAAAACAKLHVALLRALVGEAYSALQATVLSTSDMKKREVMSAIPTVDERTWPDAARRYLAAVATAQRLALSAQDGRSLSHQLLLPPPLSHLEPQVMLHFLFAGVNEPALVSRAAMLPSGASKTAAEALQAINDARALAAIERMLHQTRDSAATTGAVPAAGTSDDTTARDVRRGRLLLLKLMDTSVPARTAASASATTHAFMMNFFGHEFSIAGRMPRGLDLHAVAARLDAGLYSATGDCLAAMVADIRDVLRLWRTTLTLLFKKHKHLQGFDTAAPELADAVEAKLNAILAAGTDALDIELADAAARSSQAAAAATAAAAAEAAVSAGNTAAVGAGEVGAAAVAAEADPHALQASERLFHPTEEGCRVCWRKLDLQRLMLCDNCDEEYHCYCVEPPLAEVPEGQWYCQACEAKRRRAGAPLPPPPVKVLGHTNGSRPGVVATRQLLHLAHKLATAEYGDVGSGSSGSSGDGRSLVAPAWTPSERLELLAMLVELLVDTTLLHRPIERSSERLKEVTKEIQEVKKAARKLTFERNTAAAQQLAAAAAATAASAPAEEAEAASVAAAAAAAAVAKVSKTKMELSDKDAARLAALEAETVALEREMDSSATWRTCLGVDRHSNRYWWLGATMPDAGRPTSDTPGYVVVEQVAAAPRPSAGAAAAHAHLSESQEGGAWPRATGWGVYHTPGQVREVMDWLDPASGQEAPLHATLAQVRRWMEGPPPPQPTASTGPPAVAQAMDKGAPAQQPSPVAATMAAAANVGPGMLLRSALTAPVPEPAGANVAIVPELAGANVATVPEPAAADVAPLPETDSLDEAAPAEKPTTATTIGATASPAAAGAAKAITAPPEDTPLAALREGLLQLYRSLPRDSFRSFWGDELRQVEWLGLVEAAATPGQLSAAVSLLEGMLSDECLKPLWRLWGSPAQHPGAVGTLPQVAFRLAGLRACVITRRLPERNLPHRKGVAGAAQDPATAPSRKRAATQPHAAAPLAAPQPPLNSSEGRYPSRHRAAGAGTPAPPARKRPVPADELARNGGRTSRSRGTAPLLSLDQVFARPAKRQMRSSSAAGHDSDQQEDQELEDGAEGDKPDDQAAEGRPLSSTTGTASSDDEGATPNGRAGHSDESASDDGNAVAAQPSAAAAGGRAASQGRSAGKVVGHRATRRDGKAATQARKQAALPLGRKHYNVIIDEEDEEAEADGDASQVRKGKQLKELTDDPDVSEQDDDDSGEGDSEVDSDEPGGGRRRTTRARANSTGQRGAIVRHTRSSAAAKGGRKASFTTKGRRAGSSRRRHSAVVSEEQVDSDLEDDVVSAEMEEESDERRKKKPRKSSASADDDKQAASGGARGLTRSNGLAGPPLPPPPPTAPAAAAKARGAAVARAGSAAVRPALAAAAAGAAARRGEAQTDIKLHEHDDGNENDDRRRDRRPGREAERDAGCDGTHGRDRRRGGGESAWERDRDQERSQGRQHEHSRERARGRRRERSPSPKARKHPVYVPRGVKASYADDFDDLN